jgi:hypothetical protein
LLVLVLVLVLGAGCWVLVLGARAPSTQQSAFSIFC